MELLMEAAAHLAQRSPPDSEKNALKFGPFAGIFLVAAVDSIAAIFLYIFFIVLHHQSLRRADLGDTNGNFVLSVRATWHRMFRRFGTRNETDATWFGWIWKTISMRSEETLNRAGRDGYLYLRFQMLWIFIFFFGSLAGVPLLLPFNLSGTAPVPDYFTESTALHIQSDSSTLYAHSFFTVYISALVAVSIYATVRSIRTDKHEKESHNARLFTAKIDNFPKYCSDEALLLQYVLDLFPGQVLQVYIVPHLRKLENLLEKSEEAESRFKHYEEIYAIEGKKIQIMSGFCCAKEDALEYYEWKDLAIQSQIISEEKSERKYSGVAFVTFTNARARQMFVQIHSVLPSCCDSKPPPDPDLLMRLEKIKNTDQIEYSPLRKHQWSVNNAPNPWDVSWSNLRVGWGEFAIRFFAINLVLFIFFFFFTTPVAILTAIQAELQNWAKENNNSLNILVDISNWFKSSPVGNIILLYFPSLLLLGLTFIIPHILYYTTQLEGYHSSMEQNRAGMRKVYFYQILAILLLPVLATSSLEALVKNVLSDSKQLWEAVGLFPNAAFFVKYVLQSALLVPPVDLLRGLEFFIEKWKKWRAVTKQEFQEAEKVPLFKYGYEYSYCMLVCTIVLFYSTVVPIILPVGLLFIALKHFADKYNLCFVYPKAPGSNNSMTRTVIGCELISLVLYQMAMFAFLFFTKKMEIAGLIVIFTSGTTTIIGIWLVYGYFARMKGLKYYVGLDEVDIEQFRNAYLHPALIKLHHRHDVEILENEMKRAEEMGLKVLEENDGRYPEEMRKVECTIIDLKNSLV